MNMMKKVKRCKHCNWWIGHEEDCKIAQNCVHTFAGGQQQIKLFKLFKRRISFIQCVHCEITRVALEKLKEHKLPQHI